MAQATAVRAQCVEEIFQRVAGDLAMITDRELEIEAVQMETTTARPVGAGGIHLAFRLGFQTEEWVHHACLLMPLRQAVVLAGGLMMMPTDAVREICAKDTIDATSKEALVEVGTFVCGAADSALRAVGIAGVKTHFEGCQGVRPGVRPALVYEEGDPLVVGRARFAIADFESDEVLLIAPDGLFEA